MSNESFDDSVLVNNSRVRVYEGKDYYNVSLWVVEYKSKSNSLWTQYTIYSTRTKAIKVAEILKESFKEREKIDEYNKEAKSRAEYF